MAPSNQVRLPPGVVFTATTMSSNFGITTYNVTDNAKNTLHRWWYVACDNGHWGVTLIRSDNNDSEFFNECKVSRRMREFLITLCMMVG